MVTDNSITQQQTKNSQLVDAEGLLSTLFDANCRPSVKWVRRKTKARLIPAVKIGRFTFYDPPMVRAALDKLTRRAA